MNGQLIETRKVKQGITVIPISLSSGVYLITSEETGGSVKFAVD